MGGDECTILVSAMLTKVVANACTIAFMLHQTRWFHHKVSQYASNIPAEW